MKLLYDPDQLTYVKYKAPSGNNTTSVANPRIPGYFQYVFASAQGSFLNETTPVLTLWFTVAEDLPAGTQIRFGLSEPVKADSIAVGDYTSHKRTVGVQFKPFGIAPILGDANCDCDVTAADAALILRSLVGLDTLSATGLVNAEVDGQASVTAQDAVLILRHVVGLIGRFPAGE
jgi:hypothetical protein